VYKLFIVRTHNRLILCRWVCWTNCF